MKIMELIIDIITTTKMKNLIRLLTTLCLFTFFFQPGYSQTATDNEALLQMCIDLPELQQSLPAVNNGSISQLCILQHGVSFPSNLTLQKEGKKVLLVDKARLAELQDPYYLLFWEFKVDQNSAKADFTLNYRSGDESTDLIHFIMKAVKTGNVWEVTNYSAERR